MFSLFRKKQKPMELKESSKLATFPDGDPLGRVNLYNGKQLKPLTKCQKCESLGSQNWIFCPWCGTKRVNNGSES